MVMFLVRHPMVFIFLNLFDLLKCQVMLMIFILVIRFWQKNFSDMDIDIIRFVRLFQNFIGGIFDIVSKYNVGLKTLLLQGLSEPEFDGGLGYKVRNLIGKNEFPYHFKKIIVRYKKIGNNTDVVRPTACLVVNPLKLTVLLTSLIARRQVGLQIEWRYHLVFVLFYNLK